MALARDPKPIDGQKQPVESRAVKRRTCPVAVDMVGQRVLLLLRARQRFGCNQILKSRASPNKRPRGH